jgi:hypothetical protein
VTSDLAHDDTPGPTLGSVIAQLDDVLRRERAAIGKLDVAAVEALAQEKQELADRLAVLMLSPDGEPGAARLGTDAKKQDLRRLAVRVLASAEANRALLDDVIDSIATARGLKTRESGAYDSRARRVTQRLRTGGGKAI